MQHKVSIITPSFNRADIIHETAESIFAQTDPRWEWLITDDGSTDNSRQVLEELAARDSRVKLLFRDREPKGACTCRNISIENSTGDYLLFLDTDDLLAPFCVAQRLEAAEAHPDADFIIFPMLLFKQKPDDLGLLWNVEKKEDELSRFLSGDAICQGTGTLWKKQSFIDIGLWDEHLKLWQDVELHLRALLGHCSYVKRMDLAPDVFIRISDVSLSRTAFHSRPKLESRIRVISLAIQKMYEQNILANYQREIRHLLKDVIISAVNSGFNDLAELNLETALRYHIYSAEECRVFIRYMQTRKLKLHKLPFIQKRFLQKLSALAPGKENTIGKIRYQDADHSRKKFEPAV